MVYVSPFFTYKKTYNDGVAGFLCVIFFFLSLVPSYSLMTFITCLVAPFEGGHLWQCAS